MNSARRTKELLHMRVFIPTSKYALNSSVETSVKHWTWTKRNGLRVTYLDGLECKSAWRSLPEFLKATKDGREVTVMEVG